MRFKMVKVRKRIKVIILITLILCICLIAALYINHTEEEKAQILKKTKQREEISLIVNRISENVINSKEVETIANILN